MLTPSEDADQDDPSNQQKECAMDHGPRSTEMAEQADDSESYARGSSDAKTKDGESEQEFHGPCSKSSPPGCAGAWWALLRGKITDDHGPWNIA